MGHRQDVLVALETVNLLEASVLGAQAVALSAISIKTVFNALLISSFTKAHVCHHALKVILVLIKSVPYVIPNARPVPMLPKMVVYPVQIN